MAIEYTCPYCQAHLKVWCRADLRGVCPRCGHAIFLPAPETDTPAPQKDPLLDPYANLRRRFGIAS